MMSYRRALEATCGPDVEESDFDGLPAQGFSFGIRHIVLFVLLQLAGFALGQPEGWSLYQEAGTRVALLVEQGTGDTATYRNVLRLFTRATIGDRLFVLAFATLETDEVRGFECEEWMFSGVVSDSIVLDVERYSVYVETNDALSGVLLGMLDQVPVGSKDWGNRLTVLCSRDRAYEGEVEHQKIFVPLHGANYENMWYTPPSLWNRVMLEFKYDSDFGILDTTIH